MPRGVVLLATLLLLALIGTATVAGLLRPSASDATRELGLDRRRSGARQGDDPQSGCPACHVILGIKARGASTLPAWCRTRPTTS
jgi:hypothetical protein